MRTPLFVWMRYAQSHPHVPKELRYSKILSFQFLSERYIGMCRLSFLPLMSGHGVIDCIVGRILRESGLVRSHEVSALRLFVAETIYEHPTQMVHYERGQVHRLESGCFTDRSSDYVGMPSRLYFGGRRACSHMRVIDIPVKPAPARVCAWCGCRVYLSFSWEQDPRNKYKSIHCGSRDCRRMNYLQDVPQSRGGIDLTPAQRDKTAYEARDTQRAINYLLLIAKEKKRASRNNHDVRRRAQNHSGHGCQSA